MNTDVAYDSGGLAAVEDIYALSPMQAGMLFHAIEAPASGVYFEQLVYTLRGPLDPRAFRQAWDEATKRHAVLRTAMIWEGVERPMQVVFRRVHLPIEWIDWSSRGEDARDAALTALLEADRRKGVDLQEPPLARVLVVRWAAAEWKMVWSFHHVLLDGWSNSLLLKEVWAFYDAIARQAPLTLAAPRRYRDYIEWLEQQDLAAAETYWRAALGGVTEATPLPFQDAAPLPRTPSDAGWFGVRERLPAADRERVQAGARRMRVTINTVVQGAWALVLSRYSGERGVLFGATMAGRPPALTGVEQMVGLFINTIPVHARVPASTPIGEWLRTLQDDQAAAQQFGYTPLVTVHGWSGIPYGRAFFDSLVVFESYPTDAFESGHGVSMSGAAVRVGTTAAVEQVNYPLTLTVGVGADVQMHLSARRDLWTARDAAQILRQVGLLLTTLTSDPDRRVGDVDLVIGAEREQLIRAWNDTACERDEAPLVHEAIAARAAAQPDSIAIVTDAELVSYGELLARADRLAAALRARGVGPESRVALCLDRGPLLVAGLLGVLRAGGAYLPLDPAYPPDRIAAMLADAQVRVLVADRASRARTGVAADTDVLDIEEAMASIASPGGDRDHPDDSGHGRTHDREAGIAPARLAYVIYTSGSTGAPKGVCIGHGALRNFLHDAIDRFGIDRETVWLAVTTISFDIAALELYAPLMAGGRVVLIGRETAAAGTPLAQAIVYHQATVMQATPTLWRLLIGGGWSPVSPIVMLCGGEAMPPSLAEQLLTRGPEVWNLYGPTETTIWSAMRRLDPAADNAVGGPIANTALYVIDRADCLAPIGAIGELSIGGEGLARGYWRRPSQTAERFVPDPFSGRPGARIYRTGDRVRRRSDGGFEFLGRTDQQVKVRGYRIELGEIESALEAHPDVRQAAVICAGDEHTRRLAAYVAPVHAAHPDPRGRIERWRALWSETYREAPAAQRVDLNLAGWTNGYTRVATPVAEMAEWIDASVAAIAAERPARLLEIGCGTGLLLFRLAPHVDEYWATDFSPDALAWIERGLRADSSLAARVHLFERSADDLGGLPRRAFDCVVLNSVIQYLPDAEMLQRVLSAALDAVHDNGVVFVGDVRSLPLLGAMHSSTALERGGGRVTAGRLRREVRDRILREEELVLDPAFFRWFASRRDDVARVEMRPKRGAAVNELTMFRYDVWLRRPTPADVVEPAAWRDWLGEGWSFERLQQALAREPRQTFAFTNVPNARVARHAALWQAIQTAPEHTQVESLQASAAIESAGDGAIDPERLRTWAAEQGYTCDISLARSGEDGRFDICLSTQGAAAVRWPDSAVGDRGGRALFNDPGWHDRVQRLASELRSHLQRRLPDYMVPETFVFTDALPTTPNGKVDRRALSGEMPEPDRLGGVAGADARTPIEHIVAGIWGGILHRDRIGRHDNFFELGGHSLLATQVIARVRDAFDRDVPLRMLFEHPTLAGFAERIAAAATSNAAPPLVPRVGSDPPPLSFAQQRLWFVDQLDPGGSAYHVPCPLWLHGPLDVGVLRGAVTELVRRHETLRTRFPEIDGEPRQVIDAAATTPLPLVDLMGVAERRRAPIARAILGGELRRPFDLARGPMLRVCLIRAGDQTHALIGMLHHIACDGWSIGLLVRELSALYPAYLAGRPSPLDPLSIQYADFAVWQRNWLDGEVLEHHLDYWREQLRGLTPLMLPTDRPRTAIGGRRGRLLAVQVPSDVTQGLRALSRDESVTLFMTLLAAFMCVLARYSGQHDVAVATSIANRTHAGLEQLIGFFINQLVLRTKLDGAPTFRELLARVRRTVLDAYTYQDIPFDKLVEDLMPPRDPTRTPFADVMLLLQNHPARDIDLERLTVRRMRGGPAAAKFDLTLTLAEGPSGLSGAIEYAAALYDESTIARFARQFTAFLAESVRDPDVPIHDMALPLAGGVAQAVASFSSPLDV